MMNKTFLVLCNIFLTIRNIAGTKINHRFNISNTPGVCSFEPNSACAWRVRGWAKHYDGHISAHYAQIARQKSSGTLQSRVSGTKLAESHSLSFMYDMWGEGSMTLTVSVTSFRRKTHVVWAVFGPSFNWTRANVPIVTSQTFDVLIRAWREKRTGYIGIFAVNYSQSSCLSEPSEALVMSSANSMVSLQLTGANRVHYAENVSKSDDAGHSNFVLTISVVGMAAFVIGFSISAIFLFVYFWKMHPMIFKRHKRNVEDMHAGIKLRSAYIAKSDLSGGAESSALTAGERSTSGNMSSKVNHLGTSDDVDLSEISGCDVDKDKWNSTTTLGDSSLAIQSHLSQDSDGTMDNQSTSCTEFQTEIQSLEIPPLYTGAECELQRHTSREHVQNAADCESTVPSTSRTRDDDKVLIATYNPTVLNERTLQNPSFADSFQSSEMVLRDLTLTVPICENVYNNHKAHNYTWPHCARQFITIGDTSGKIPTYYNASISNFRSYLRTTRIRDPGYNMNVDKCDDVNHEKVVA